MDVDRCVCNAVSFDALKRLAAREGLDFDGLRARTGCGGGCGLCEPYVRLMLRSGHTSFPLMSEGEARRVCERERGAAR